jgi:hypothetical protein
MTSKQTGQQTSCFEENAQMASPPYTSWLGHGTLCATPPVTFADVNATVFGVNASISAIQALVDKLLKPTARGLVKYSCPVGAVLVTFLDSAHCASTVDQIGWMPGRECAVWVMLLEERLDFFHQVRPVLWAPYIFINTDFGLVPGREIWGWPKSIGTIAVASDAPAAPAHFGITTDVFKVFDPTKRGEQLELISVTGTHPLTPAASSLLSAAAVVESLAASLAPDLDPLIALQLALSPTLPAIATKQFRDSLDPDVNCFRALVNAPCRVTSFYSGHLLNDTFTLNVKTCASHAIVKDLFAIAPGTVSTSIPVVWAAALKFDFLAENGSTIVPPG